MVRYAAFLRAVNVGSGRRVAMDELRAMAAALGLVDPRSYIQSGNLVFSSDSTDRDAIVRSLGEAIGARFGFVPEIFLRDATGMRAIMERVPGLPDGMGNSDKLHVVILSREPALDARASLADHLGPWESFELAGDVIYVHYGNGVGRSRFSNSFIEKRLGLFATTRTLATMVAMLGMVEAV